MPRSRRDEKDRDRKSSSKSSDRKRSSSRHRDRDRDRSIREEEDEEERLLRKAKEYVEKEKHKKSSRKSSHRRSRSRSPSEDKEEERRSSRKRRSSGSKHHDDNRKRSKRDDYDDDNRSSNSEEWDHRHRKEEKSRKRHRSEDDSDSEDSRRDRKKKHSSRKSSRDDRKHKNKKDHTKKEDKKKESKKDSKKKDRKSDKSSSCKSKAIKPDKSKLVDLGSPPGLPPRKLIDAEEDYFSFHQSLWVWLYREEGLAFNDLTSEESREAFGRFVTQYNKGQLEAAYYDEKGLPPQAMEECKTTRHKWTFQTSETERKGLQMLQDGVRKLTEYSEGNKKKKNEATQMICQPVQQGAQRVKDREDQPEEAEDNNRRAWTAEERMAQRVANRRLKEHVRTAEEEFGGGRADYGRERQLEKKKEAAAKIHGAARDREDMGVTISDDALYGDGGHGASFQAALARERKRKAQRDETKQARIQELQQKEQNKQQAMLDMLGLGGLTPGQKIKIAPRKDGS